MKQTCSGRATRIRRVGFDVTSQEQIDVTTCNLCHGSHFVLVNHKDRYGYPVTATACRDCGLVFLSPVMTASAYGKFYEKTYRPLVSAYHAREINAETIQEEQQEYAQDLIKFLTPFLVSRRMSNMLDIGGSTGVVSHAVGQEFGLRGTVLDPAPMEVEKARELGLETITGFVEDLDPGDMTYDVILLCQTIDHLLDVAGSLQKIHRLLKSSGLFFVDIVDFRAAYLRNLSVEEAIKVDHPYYLTEQTAIAYLTAFGFDILRTSYAADHLHIGYVCRRAAPRSDFMPSSHGVTRMFEELRSVQNRALRQ